MEKEMENNEVETLRMRLAACGVGALANTPDSAKTQRIGKDSPYWCASVQDVYDAVDREMAALEREKLLEEALNLCAVDTIEKDQRKIAREALSRVKAMMERK